MPATRLSQEFEMQTRDRFTKVDTEIILKVDGKELPNMEVLGIALEKAIELIVTSIKESYLKVPERTETPMAEPYGTTPKPETETLQEVT